MCGVIYDLKPHTHYLNNLCSQKRFYCVKTLLLTLHVMMFSTFEHTYITTAWYSIDFSEMHDNLNVLFEILLMSVS